MSDKTADFYTYTGRGNRIAPLLLYGGTILLPRPVYSLNNSKKFWVEKFFKIFQNGGTQGDSNSLNHSLIAQFADEHSHFEIVLKTF